MVRSSNTAPKNGTPNRKLKLDEFLPFLLSTTSNAVSNLVARTYQNRFGLSIPEWRLITVLAETPGLTQQALCDRTLMDKVMVSRGAHSLVGKRLARRAPHSADARSHTLVLTVEGLRLFNEVAPAALAIEGILFEAFGTNEMAQFAAFLNQVRSRAAALLEDELPLRGAR